jgi:P-type conjugative transfer protein TrbJ
MTMQRRNFLGGGLSAVCLATLAALNPSVSRAGAVVGATEMTQIANNVELVMQYLQQMESYATQLRQWETQMRQYANAVQNTLNIPKQVWNAVTTDLMGVAQIVRSGRSLAYSASNIAEQFGNTFKGYNAPTNFRQAYSGWSASTLDTLKGAFAANQLQAAQFANEEGTLAYLRAQSESAEGQMQAIQVGAQIAEQQVQQLQKLRQLMMVQSSAQNAYLAAQTDKDAAARATADGALRYRAPANAPGKVFKGGTL